MLGNTRTHAIPLWRVVNRARAPTSAPGHRGRGRRDGVWELGRVEVLQQVVQLGEVVGDGRPARSRGTGRPVQEGTAARRRGRRRPVAAGAGGGHLPHDVLVLVDGLHQGGTCTRTESEHAHWGKNDSVPQERLVTFVSLKTSESCMCIRVSK